MFIFYHTTMLKSHLSHLIAVCNNFDLRKDPQCTKSTAIILFDKCSKYFGGIDAHNFHQNRETNHLELVLAQKNGSLIAASAISVAE